jgi:hypothetical protein
MRSPAEKVISVIGWGVFLALIAIFFTPEDDSSSVHFQHYAVIGLSLWVTACFAYIFTSKSTKALHILFRNLVVVAVIIAGYMLISAGNPSYDEDGFVLDEGYNTSFENRCTVAVLTFFKVVGGGVIGIIASDYFRKKKMILSAEDND